MRRIIEDVNRKFVRIEDQNGVELLDNPFGHIFFEKGYWQANADLCRIVASARFEKFDDQIHRYVAPTVDGVLQTIANAINPNA